MNSENIFRYSYSAKQNAEVQAIRSKYLPCEESKLDELKRLDCQVSRAGLPQALTIGIVGCLVFGVGMCIAMEVLRGGMVLGALIGACGITVMIVAYPVYCTYFRKAKTKHQLGLWNSLQN